MDELDRYWNIWCISPGSRLRYRKRAVPAAQAFYMTQFIDSQGDCQHREKLFSLFQLSTELQTSIRKATISAQAGLCLRCYISSPILEACQKIDSLFAGNKAFSYHDLLSFVLNDDGKKLILVDEENKTQVAVEAGQIETLTFNLFSVDVLQSYRSGTRNSMSLESWTFLRVKQQPELKNFLSEFGFQSFSDWTLLNRIQVNQRERLTERDRRIVDVFHRVYRRDRRKRGKFSRCTSPTDDQLSRMNALLAKTGEDFADLRELLSAIKQIAQQLRTFDIWQAREPLEVKDVETGDYKIRRDLPAVIVDAETLEEQELIAFLDREGRRSLAFAVEQSVQARLAKLKKSKRYSSFAACYIPGLLRYYQEGISLRAIGEELGMNNWDRTRRFLNPGELLSQVRSLVTHRLQVLTLEKAQAKGLIAKPPEPDKLKQLMEEMDSFLDKKYFMAAATELKAGKNRALESEYALQLIEYLNKC